jgi:hypothetical protein
METSLFTFDYPLEAVAQHPLPLRDGSRMMVLNRAGQNWDHRRFSDLSEYLREGDLLVLNNAEADLIEKDGRKVPPHPPYKQSDGRNQHHHSINGSGDFFVNIHQVLLSGNRKIVGFVRRHTSTPSHNIFDFIYGFIN